MKKQSAIKLNNTEYEHSKKKNHPDEKGLLKGYSHYFNFYYYKDYPFNSYHYLVD